MITDKDFKELFWLMTKADPAKRATIDTIKKSKWYKRPIYTSDQYQKIMKKCFK